MNRAQNFLQIMHFSTYAGRIENDMLVIKNILFKCRYFQDRIVEETVVAFWMFMGYCLQILLACVVGITSWIPQGSLMDEWLQSISMVRTNIRLVTSLCTVTISVEVGRKFGQMREAAKLLIRVAESGPGPGNMPRIRIIGNMPIRIIGMKAKARTHPGDYARFQNYLWMVWKDRFRAKLQPPDSMDKEASKYWIKCRQRDLCKIIRTLELWNPFYVEGEKTRLKTQSMKLKVMKMHRDGHVGDVERKDAEEGKQSSADQIRRSGRAPKPRRLADNSIELEES
ncbi:uncharacterized protein EV420DRAFT_1482016 [Desarmillaria tabescens]|uniref:Uncharacterized protein n=1 Tax=Armillaria tabescens TaxID=1929756 RepID=A0AA39K1Y6_ARMTA|nr:uncharacterized protein EV420DRAFT_1482016 [Desarmillaria tabescens]KAK0453025.1 hypothetical protein EV420DRAFT_1482016 [Desarmillaria tabescens]